MSMKAKIALTALLCVCLTGCNSESTGITETSTTTTTVDTDIGVTVSPELEIIEENQGDLSSDIEDLFTEEVPESALAMEFETYAVSDWLEFFNQFTDAADRDAYFATLTEEDSVKLATIEVLVAQVQHNLPNMGIAEFTTQDLYINSDIEIKLASCDTAKNNLIIAFSNCTDYNMTVSIATTDADCDITDNNFTLEPGERSAKSFIYFSKVSKDTMQEINLKVDYSISEDDAKTADIVIKEA